MPFTEIAKLIASKNFKSILDYCQQQEIESKNIELIKSYYGVYLLSYLINNDIINAKHLWKRISNDLKQSNQQLKNIYTIIKSISQANPTITYTALSINLGDDYTPFITTLKENFQQRTFELISNAYSSITVSDCSSYLGISPDDTIQFTTSKGWEHDKASNTLKPIPIHKQITGLPTGGQQIRSLTNYVLFLEKST
ncbi:hypothetical protein RB653_002551 [Dictyostelium firmibasis]|uniref:COP9 signalosome complex subunit 8 n=1 Tax=Dictyostelium firmibasis TaxID=79012 RepID=A0AAN7U9G7_9MYCE